MVRIEREWGCLDDSTSWHNGISRYFRIKILDEPNIRLNFINGKNKTISISGHCCCANPLMWFAKTRTDLN